VEGDHGLATDERALPQLQRGRLAPCSRAGYWASVRKARAKSGIRGPQLGDGNRVLSHSRWPWSRAPRVAPSDRNPGSRARVGRAPESATTRAGKTAKDNRCHRATEHSWPEAAIRSAPRPPTPSFQNVASALDLIASRHHRRGRHLPRCGGLDTVGCPGRAGSCRSGGRWFRPPSPQKARIGTNASRGGEGNPAGRGEGRGCSPLAFGTSRRRRYVQLCPHTRRAAERQGRFDRERSRGGERLA
jgi:hypothetical protein